jgi:AraC-like DNA-binding protein
MPISAAFNQLWLPRPELLTCVRCFISRNTTAVNLTEADRYNHYPATPLCSVGWWWAGSAEYLAPGAPASPNSARNAAPAKVVVAGPHTHPTISYNPGPAHGVMMMLMPDALEQLTGLSPKQLTNKTVSAHQHLPPEWLAMLNEVLRCHSEQAATQVIERFLLHRWPNPATTANDQAPSLRLRHWLQHVSQRAWHSEQGRSWRQMQRRMRQWTGQSHRDLHVLAKAESAFLNLMARHPTPMNWADAATGTGYADQSHMGRVAKRLTGFSPETLRRKMSSEEAFWLYRLWA